MDRTIHLALYGGIEHGPEDDLAWDMYQTQALARLRDISLSSTPSIFAPHGLAASRFHHSVGITYLAKIIASKLPELTEWRNTLIAAALCHDTGSPPFSHVSEIFLYDMLGQTHEQRTDQLLAPGQELHELLTTYNVNPEHVIQAVNGVHPTLGALMAGSIDLDNLDNSLHLLVSLGYGDPRPYDPVKLVDAFVFEEGHLCLKSEFSDQIAGWEEARNQLYSILHGEPNLSAATMIYRAIEFAYEAELIDEDFFSFGESQALYFLANRCGRKTKSLIERLSTWRHHGMIYSRSHDNEDLRLKSLYEDWRLRKNFTDQICDAFGVSQETISFYVGRDKGVKSIHLPFVGAGSEEAESRFKGSTGKQYLAVFASPATASHIGSGELQSVIDDLIKELPEIEHEPHVFY